MQAAHEVALDELEERVAVLDEIGWPHITHESAEELDTESIP